VCSVARWPHVVPRAADLPQDLTGPRIFGLLGSTDPVPPEEQDRLAVEIGAASGAHQKRLDAVP
jgi:hypothetical protein